MGAKLELRTLGLVRLDGPAGELLPRRRKDLVALCLLALRAPAAMRREELLALLWGDRDEARARHSLRQVLVRLRGACGDVLDVGPDTIRVDANALWLDARAFSEAAEAGRYRDAIELWQGELLPACEDSGDEGFRTWLEVERERMRRRLGHCFDCVTASFEKAGRWNDAARWAERWTTHFPLEGAPRLRLIRALSGAGRAAEADAARGIFIRTLREELDDEPDAEWLAATQRLLEDARERQPEVVVDSNIEEEIEVATSRAPIMRRRRVPVLAVLALLLVSTLAWGARLLNAPESAPVVALGHIEMIGVPDSMAASPVLLALGLSRAPELRVLSEARIQGARSQLGQRGADGIDLQRAARAAGATVLIEGVLARRAPDRWRLELRRLDLRTQTANETYLEEGADLIELFDRVTQRIARDLAVALPSDQFVGAPTSVAAYRMYQEGLRAYYDGDASAAGRLFNAALAEDSMFGMAALYAARLSSFYEANALFDRAWRASARAPDRDRLLIRAAWLARRQEPGALAVAETLTVRYPAEPDGHQQYAEALVMAGRFAEAVLHYKRVIELDSLGLRGVSPRCLACDAYHQAALAYRRADSAAAAERLGREWLRRQPTSFNAWFSLAGTVGVMGRYDEAFAIVDSAARYDRYGRVDAEGMPDLWLRAGRFAVVDAFARAKLARSTPDDAAEWHEIAWSSLRMQGRHREAMQHALALRRIGTLSRDASLHEAHRHAATLFEQQHYRASALLFDSIAHVPLSDSPARNGRHVAWLLTQAAAGYARAGDTVRLRQIEDTIRMHGARSNYLTKEEFYFTL